MKNLKEPLPEDTDAARPGDSYVQSFARGLAVIRSFDANRPAQTLTEVAAASGLTRAGARRILLTLQALGYVEADGRLFQLTPKILDLGFAYLTSMPFWNLAEPVMEELVEQVHESCSAAVLNGTDIVYVLRVPTTHKIITLNLSIGSRLPAFCTSMGRMLLSAVDDDQLDAVLDASDLVARTPRTITEQGGAEGSHRRRAQPGLGDRRSGTRGRADFDVGADPRPAGSNHRGAQYQRKRAEEKREADGESVSRAASGGGAARFGDGRATRIARDKHRRDYSPGRIRRYPLSRQPITPSV